MSVNHSTRSGGRIGIYFRFFNVKVYCVFLLESPHRGDSNEYIQYIIFNMKKKNTLNSFKSAAVEFVRGTQERIRNSRVRAIEVLLYMQYSDGIFITKAAPVAF